MNFERSLATTLCVARSTPAPKYRGIIYAPPSVATSHTLHYEMRKMKKNSKIKERKESCVSMHLSRRMLFSK